MTDTPAPAPPQPLIGELPMFSLSDAIDILLRWRAAGVAAERQRIRPALEDALEGLREMLPYCGDYFRDKWQLDAYVERAERAVADLLDGGGQEGDGDVV